MMRDAFIFIVSTVVPYCFVSIRCTSPSSYVVRSEYTKKLDSSRWHIP